MGLAGNKPSKAISFTYKFLLVCIAVLLLILVAGTLYAVYIKTSPMHKPEAAQKSSGGQVFTGIGQIRAHTADPQPGTAVLMVSFIYYPEDKAFTEELALRVGDFREIIKTYIASYRASELLQMGDDAIKTELLRRFNSVLRLGQIETLYFSDFVIVG